MKPDRTEIKDVQTLRKNSMIIAFAALFSILAIPSSAPGADTVRWDFTQGTLGWRANQQVADLASTDAGLRFRSTANDPWIEGPPVDLGATRLARVRIRMRSDVDTAGELFYGRQFTAGKSVRFAVYPDGKWHEYELTINDQLGPRTRFRLDPCTREGQVTVAWIEVEAIEQIGPPPLPIPQRPTENDTTPIRIAAQNVEVVHYGDKWGSFLVLVDGLEMAAGHNAETIGYLDDDGPQWLSMADAEVQTEVQQNERIEVQAVISDRGGATWHLKRTFRASEINDAITVETEVAVDKDRKAILVPWLTLLPGLGTYGQNKDQGLFAGLEYLSNEPSSSRADIETSEHVRRVPDPVKITFPLMAITAQSRYIGLTWEPSETMTPIFDSPDRIYGSAAHVMALSGPAVGRLRFENALCGHSPLLLAASKPLKITARILGGTGNAVTEAVKHYVRINGLPDVPEFAGGFERAVRMLAHGWLDSAAHRDGLWRHAVWGDKFGPTPAADAVMYMEWLAAHTQDQHLARKLQQAGIRGLEQIGDSRPFSSTISHAHVMSAPLLFGKIGSFVKQQSRIARDHLGTFSTDGIKLYRPGKVDYGRTHFAHHANGISGRSMVAILEGAAFSGDRQLIDAALTMLDQVISVYAGTVPRGAQTWEVPLHTPDILASAHMVKACTLGYVLSGRQEYLQEARYWAWTGVPFVYLSRPAEGPVGTYATIAVLGATNWKAPVWFGQPVQWCGLVYAYALQMLARYDGEGPWEQIADGITATGLQMTWPLSDTERQGLLPDYFDLRAQVGLGPAINPGTVQAQLPQLYDRGTLYTVARVPMNDWFVHAPCHIGGIHRTGQMVDIEIDGWTTRPYYVLVTGLEKKPTAMSLNVKATEDLPQHKHQPGTVEYDAEGRFVQFHLQGKARIQIVP